MTEKRWLLDTNVISEMRRQKPHGGVKSWFKANPDVAIGFPVWFEIERGILLDPDREHAEKLRLWRDELRQTEYYEPPMTQEVATLLAAMYVCRPLLNLWLTETPWQKSMQDLLLAALAIVHDYTVVTRDIHDFRRVHEHFPLPGLYCPFTDHWEVHPNHDHSRDFVPRL